MSGLRVHDVLLAHRARRCGRACRLASPACRPAARRAASRSSCVGSCGHSKTITSPRRGSRSAGSRLPVNGTSAPYTSLFTSRKSPTSSVRSMLPLGILNASTMNVRTNRKTSDRDRNDLRPLPQNAQHTTARLVRRDAAPRRAARRDRSTSESAGRIGHASTIDLCAVDDASSPLEPRTRIGNNSPSTAASAGN